MAKVREQIEAEFENISRLVAELPGEDVLAELSSLELAGVGALVHNFYNGVENILKQIVISRDITISQSQSWHRQLVETAVLNDIISKSTAEQLRQYLAFRHFFAHGYSLDLDKEHIKPLVKAIPNVLADFSNEINNALR